MYHLISHKRVREVSQAQWGPQISFSFDSDTTAPSNASHAPSEWYLTIFHTQWMRKTREIYPQRVRLLSKER